VAGSEVTAPGQLLARLRPGPPGLSALRPAWSVPAAMRAVRATLVVPVLLALTFKVIGDPQMALFAVFGAFASLVMVTFGGTRRDRLIAHLELAVVGSIVLMIGTAVSGTAWLAAIVTIPVAFGIFFAGVTGPHAASGTTAALLAYVLPVASPGGVATIPSRLEGWWLAAAVSTAAVLLLSPRAPADRLRAVAAASAAALADLLAAALRGEVKPAGLQASVAANHELMTAFGATPYRPTGLATADQAMSSVVQLLEWCATLISDAMDEHLDPRRAAQADRDLLGVTAGVLRDVAALLAGQDAEPDLVQLEDARAASTVHLRTLDGDPGSVRVSAVNAFHAQVIAVAASLARAHRRRAPCLVRGARRRPGSWAQARRAGFGGRTRRPGLRGQARRLGPGGLARRRGQRRRRRRPARELPVGVAAQQPARRRGPGRGGGGGRPHRRAARLLGGARRALGAPHERRVHRSYGAAGAGGHGTRFRGRRRAAPRHRHRADRAVGRDADCRPDRLLCAGDGAVRGRPGRLYRYGPSAVQPARPGRLEGGPAAGPGRRDRLRGQPGGRAAVLAARRLRGGRRRPRRRLSRRHRVPDPGGGLGAGTARAGARHRGRGGDRGTAAGRRASRVPGRAGLQADRERRSVASGDGHPAAPADRALAGRPARPGRGHLSGRAHARGSGTRRAAASGRRPDRLLRARRRPGRPPRARRAAARRDSPAQCPGTRRAGHPGHLGRRGRGGRRHHAGAPSPARPLGPRAPGPSPPEPARGHRASPAHGRTPPHPLVALTPSQAPARPSPRPAPAPPRPAALTGLWRLRS